jgi:hypothetical protein
VHDESGRFVDDRDVGILKENPDRDVLRSDFVGAPRRRKLDRDDVTGMYEVRTFGDRFAADRDFLLLDEFRDGVATLVPKKARESHIETFTVERGIELDVPNVVEAHTESIFGLLVWNFAM